FGGRDTDARAKQIALYRAPHLLDRKRPCLAHDEIRLPGGCHVDDIELAATMEGIDSRVRIRVVLMGGKTGEKSLKRRRVRIDDEVEVLAAAGYAVKRAGE